MSNGDPTINPRHPERWAAFDDWAKQLAAKGVKTIGGHLIGDDNAFAEPGWGLGWAWDDFVSATARRSARCSTTRTRSSC